MNKPIIKVSRSTYNRYKKDFKEGSGEITICIDEDMSDDDFIVIGKVVDFFGEPARSKPANKYKEPCQSNKSDRKRNRKNRWS